MKAIILFLSVAFTTKATLAQTVTFSEHVAPILYSKCSSCHREGSIGPFPLITYDDAYSHAFDIAQETQEGHMPPWPPDPEFSRFSHERRLSQAEINTLYDWVNQGAHRGDSNLAPPVPVFTSTDFIPAPDLKVRIEPYTIESNEDVYRSFVISGKVLTDQYITEAEFVPANKKAVHHILLFYDTSGVCRQLDQMDPKPGYESFGGVGAPKAVLLSGWVPGAMPLKYPTGMGSFIPANADIVIQIHYAPESLGEADSSSLNLMLKAPGGIRQVSFQPALNHSSALVNGPLFIPANTVKTFYSQLTVPYDASIMGVAPHMHLLGQTIKAFAVKPDGDTVNLIRINHWHFHWQGMYNFKKLIFLPKNTELYGEATYDNTTANPENPSNPPKDVGLGESTTDEMFLVYFNYLLYKPGDENISLEDSVPAGIRTYNEEKLNCRLYPNPAADKLTIEVDLPESVPVSFYIYDLQGRLVKNISEKRLPAGRNYLTADIGELAAGSYVCRARGGSYSTAQRLNVLR